ncbi:MFS transporter [Microbacterium rhizosphaerae]
MGLGFVSLGIDMVADGAASVSGALLAGLGASAVLVGVVAGGAEALALLLRLVTGPWSDRTRAYWTFTIVGYAMTAISVPLLAITPLLGSVGLAVACALLLIERTGKAVRAPSKTVLLADAAQAVGAGRGFGVHKMLDQIGAFSGPLLVAGITAVAGTLWPAFLVLIIPAAVAMVLLFWLRARVPDPSLYRRADAGPATSDQPSAPAPAAVPAPARKTYGTFLLFSLFAGLTTFGLLSYSIVSFHLVQTGLVALPAIPLLYAVGMAAAAVSALATGWAYDRWGPAVLLAVPILTVFVPGLSLGATLVAVVSGIVLWGAASGVQDSTVKALVAELAPSGRGGSAYGWFAVFQGAGALAGAIVAGALYANVPALITIVVVLQAVAIVLLVLVLRRRKARAGAV